MLIVIVTFATCALLLLAPACGLAAPFFAGRRTIWKAFGLWGIGLGAGMAGILLSFVEDRLRVVEARAAGGHPLNDMPGFGQALVGLFGFLCFAAVFALILFIYGVSLFLHWRRRRAG